MKREFANDKSVSEGKFLCFVAEKKRDEPELVDVVIKEAANNTVYSQGYRLNLSVVPRDFFWIALCELPPLC